MFNSSFPKFRNNCKNYNTLNDNLVSSYVDAHTKQNCFSCAYYSSQKCKYDTFDMIDMENDMFY